MEPDLLKIMEEIGLIAIWTGVKAQFVEAGWSPENAELMTLETFRLNIKNTAAA